MATPARPADDAGPGVSVVIPVLHDTPALEGLLRHLDVPRTGDATPSGPAPEVIVVNGDAADATLTPLRERYPAVRWLDSEPGRARQMNAGAAVAGGAWLLFLHADTRPAPGWRQAVERVAAGPAVAGAFRFTLDSPRRRARLLEWLVAQRVRWRRLPYGDQGVFVRRDVFRRLGGYAPLPMMEDVELVRRLPAEGPLAWLRLPIVVSPRRWEREGWLRRSIGNLVLLCLYDLGVSPVWLADRYYGRRATQPTPEPPPADDRPGPPLDADTARIVVIMPALNEEEGVAAVIGELPEVVDQVTVVDNGSTDDTAGRAQAVGARVVREPRRGYGRACLAGLAVNREADLVVFLDADRSDYPQDLWALLDPVLAGDADFVLGKRGGEGRPFAARVGTTLCVALINRFWGTAYEDLGPFRVIRRSALDRLEMADETWGWTIEMQVKAAEAGLRTVEVPIRQRVRLGRSKISGTVLGTLRAGVRMLAIIAALRMGRHARSYGHDSGAER